LLAFGSIPCLASQGLTDVGVPFEVLMQRTEYRHPRNENVWAVSSALSVPAPQDAIRVRIIVKNIDDDHTKREWEWEHLDDGSKHRHFTVFNVKMQEEHNGVFLGTSDKEGQRDNVFGLIGGEKAGLYIYPVEGNEKDFAGLLRTILPGMPNVSEQHGILSRWPGVIMKGDTVAYNVSGLHLEGIIKIKKSDQYTLVVTTTAMGTGTQRGQPVSYLKVLTINLKSMMGGLGDKLVASPDMPIDGFRLISCCQGSRRRLSAPFVELMKQIAATGHKFH